ncbi:MAG: Indole-3-glycerol phosphate synthase [Verrucomicrobiae bacterium]|nr:Indole-3-glycerol phosphate synthase [Verrucomicrobiae bacterium]
MKTNILDRIVAEKRREVAALLPHAGRIKQAVAMRRDYRDFAGALQKTALIAEVKKASPSAGVIAHNFDPVGIARQYEGAGAAAISVLTDEKFFQGKLDYLRQIREAVRLPLLRKDFIIDELQVYEAVAGGADAILLIAAILTDSQLRDYRALAEHLKLAALVEVHDEAELNRALNSGAGIIGINNRDLKTFKVSLTTTERLAAQIPEDRIVVAESGINTRADVERLGTDAILVGESLMKSGDVAGKVKELLG